MCLHLFDGLVSNEFVAAKQAGYCGLARLEVLLCFSVVDRFLLAVENWALELELGEPVPCVQAEFWVLFEWFVVAAENTGAGRSVFLGFGNPVVNALFVEKLLTGAALFRLKGDALANGANVEITYVLGRDHVFGAKGVLKINLAHKILGKLLEDGI